MKCEDGKEPLPQGVPPGVWAYLVDVVRVPDLGVGGLTSCYRRQDVGPCCVAAIREGDKSQIESEVVDDLV